MNTGSYPYFKVLYVGKDATWFQSFSTVLCDLGVTNIAACTEEQNLSGQSGFQEAGLILYDAADQCIHFADLHRESLKMSFPVSFFLLTRSPVQAASKDGYPPGVLDVGCKEKNEEMLARRILKAVQFHETIKEYYTFRDLAISNILPVKRAFDSIVTQDPGMKNILQYMESISGNPRPLLISGETGTGKELLAGVMHKLRGAKGPFVPVSLTELDDNGFVELMFGQSRKTMDADGPGRDGILEKAANGTVYLKNIDALSIATQQKVRSIFRRKMGSVAEDNAMLIVSTLQKPDYLVEHQSVDPELFSHLLPRQIHMPPLRKRREDVPLLVEHFLKQAAEGFRKQVPPMDSLFLDCLQAYNFPGNVQELKELIFDVMRHHERGELSLDSLAKTNLPPGHEKKVLRKQKKKLSGKGIFADVKKLPTLKQCSQLLIEEAMKRTEGNMSQASKILGITRQGLSWHLHKNEKKK